MGLVQIEDSELATLRSERNEARTKVDTQANELRELTAKVETAEAAKVAAEAAKATAETKVTQLTEATAASALKDKRMGALGAGFLAKLGDTSKTVLTDLAAKASDDEWELALKEREEMASKLANVEIKRDLAADGTPPPAGGGTPPPAGNGGSAFASEEVASFMQTTTAVPAGTTPDGASSVRTLARSFGKPKVPAGQGK